MNSGALTVVSHWARARLRSSLLRGKSLAWYQDRMARRTVEYACRHSPYYAALFAGRSPAEWQRLPTSDKASMMGSFDTFNTCGISREEAMLVALQAETTRDFHPTIQGLTVGLSSGTSGHRGLFVVSPWEQAAWAGAVLARTMPPVRRQGYRTALFHRSNSNLYQQIDSRWIQLRYYDLMLPLHSATMALNEYRPDILIGPPSLLVLLAQARKDGALRIAPSRIYSAAEVLEDQDRQQIESCFDIQMGQIYQCTEGLLAVSCSHHSLHLQEDLAAIQTEPLPGLGAEQRVTPIVTDLWRRVQPIIRYRLNDVLTIDPRPCGCGSAFRVVTRIEGRCDDVCYFQGNDGSLRPFFPDTIRRIILLSSDLITDYRAVQDAPGRLQINLQILPGSDFDPVENALRNRIEATMRQYNCYPAQITIEEGISISPARAKLRRVQRIG